MVNQAAGFLWCIISSLYPCRTKWNAMLMLKKYPAPLDKLSRVKFRPPHVVYGKQITPKSRTTSPGKSSPSEAASRRLQSGIKRLTAADKERLSAGARVKWVTVSNSLPYPLLHSLHETVSVHPPRQQLGSHLGRHYCLCQMNGSLHSLQ